MQMPGKALKIMFFPNSCRYFYNAKHLTMNTELLLKVKEAILNEPKQFVMDAFFSNSLQEHARVLGITFDNYSEINTESLPSIPNCGTAACIAGWTISIAYRLNLKDARKYTIDAGYDYDTEARLYLNIGYDTGEKLFYRDYWPDDLRIRWVNAKSLEERAQIAAERIDRFIVEYNESTYDPLNPGE